MQREGHARAPYSRTAEAPSYDFTRRRCLRSGAATNGRGRCRMRPAGKVKTPVVERVVWRSAGRGRLIVVGVVARLTVLVAVKVSVVAPPLALFFAARGRAVGSHQFL